MDVITLSKELGKAIQKDDRYIAYTLAAQANEDNAELKGKIERFNQIREELNVEVQKAEKDTALVEKLNGEFRAIYAEIVAMPGMVVFNNAKTQLDSLINHVNAIISAACNGEDPEAVTEEVACGGSCSSCSGCN